MSLGKPDHHSYYPFTSSLASLRNKSVSLPLTLLALMLSHFYSDIPPTIYKSTSSAFKTSFLNTLQSGFCVHSPSMRVTDVHLFARPHNFS